MQDGLPRVPNLNRVVFHGSRFAATKSGPRCGAWRQCPCVGSRRKFVAQFRWFSLGRFVGALLLMKNILLPKEFHSVTSAWGGAIVDPVLVPTGQVCAVVHSH